MDLQFQASKQQRENREMDAHLQASKPHASLLPLENSLVGMLALLDLNPTDGLEGPSSNIEDTDSGEESNLPPPMPLFDRRTNATASAPMLLHGVLSRARSSSPNRGACGAPRGRDVLQTRAMAVSMPNLHSSRSTYNRGIGYSVLANAAECGGKQGKQALRSRIEEFETLLGDL